jgi:hypothetical protein
LYDNTLDSISFFRVLAWSSDRLSADFGCIELFSIISIEYKAISFKYTFWLYSFIIMLVVREFWLKPIALFEEVVFPHPANKAMIMEHSKSIVTLFFVIEFKNLSPLST